MPEGNFDSGPKKQNKIKRYIEKNKFLTGMVCILVVLLVIMAIVYSYDARKKLQASADTGNASGIDISKSQNIDVLPQIQRNEDTKQTGNSKSDTSQDPFTGPVVLKGTIIGDNGNNQALISSGGISYVVKVNEKIGNIWTVKKIDRKEVILQSGTKEMTLRLQEYGAAAGR